MCSLFNWFSNTYGSKGNTAWIYSGHLLLHVRTDIFLKAEGETAENNMWIDDESYFEDDAEVRQLVPDLQIVKIGMQKTFCKLIFFCTSEPFCTSQKKVCLLPARGQTLWQPEIHAPAKKFRERHFRCLRLFAGLEGMEPTWRDQGPGSTLGWWRKLPGSGSTTESPPPWRPGATLALYKHINRNRRKHGGNFSAAF